MKKYIIQYGPLVIKAHVTEDNTTILDSYRIKKYSDMRSVLYRLSTRVGEDYDILYKRTMPNLVREWRVHNMFYSLGIMRKRTKDVDFEVKQPWYMKALYFILSPFYLHFS